MAISRFPRLIHSNNLPHINPRAVSVRERCYTDFKAFIEEFFADHLWGEMSAMHWDFCALEAQPDRRGIREATAAPRGNAKTTLKVLIKAVHAIVYGYHPFILVIGYSKTEASDKLKDIRSELLYNDKLLETFGPQLNPKKAGGEDFITFNDIRVTARGTGGQVRGLKYRHHRPSLILLDDIETLEHVQTPEQRTKTENWFKKDVMGCGRADGSSTFMIVGTILHKESLLSNLLASPGWQAYKYKAVLADAERQDLWQQWKDLYCNLEDAHRTATAQAFYKKNEAAMLQGVETLWPAGDPYVRIQEYILTNGLASYNSEKQNDPYDPDKQILNPDICERFRVIWPGDTRWPEHIQPDGFIILGQEDRYAVHSSQLTYAVFHDPALAEKNKSDYAAIVVCGQDPSGYIYVLDVWLKREPPARQIKQALEMARRWNFDKLYLETNNFQGLLKQPYKEALQAEQMKLRVVGVDQHTNKLHRISTLEPYFSNGWIRLREALDANWLDQLRLFPTDHDDGPDALHGCVERLRKPGGTVKTLSGQRGVT